MIFQVTLPDDVCKVVAAYNGWVAINDKDTTYVGVCQKRMTKLFLDEYSAKKEIDAVQVARDQAKADAAAQLVTINAGITILP